MYSNHSHVLLYIHVHTVTHDMGIRYMEIRFENASKSYDYCSFLSNSIDLLYAMKLGIQAGTSLGSPVRIHITSLGTTCITLLVYLLDQPAGFQITKQVNEFIITFLTSVTVL